MSRAGAFDIVLDVFLDDNKLKLEFRRKWRFLTGTGVMIMFLMFFKSLTNLSCLKLSRILLKIDDTLREFGTTWRFLTGAGIHDHVF